MTFMSSYNIYKDKRNTEGDKAMSHPWKSRGDKRTIVGHYKPQEEVMKYLTGMQSAIRYAIEVAYEMAIHDCNRIPSPIALRSSHGSRQTTIMRFTTSAPFMPLPCSGHTRRTIMAS
ncbi:MAG: hypothetical protein QW338_00675 [Conexivisphaerales archaeon]